MTTREPAPKVDDASLHVLFDSTANHPSKQRLDAMARAAARVPEVAGQRTARRWRVAAVALVGAAGLAVAIYASRAGEPATTAQPADEGGGSAPPPPSAVADDEDELLSGLATAPFQPDNGLGLDLLYAPPDDVDLAVWLEVYDEILEGS